LRLLELELMQPLCTPFSILLTLENDSAERKK